MNPQHSSAITTQAQAGVRRSAATIAGGVAGASVVALLAVASVAAPALAGGVTLASVLAWLGGLGSNALATWLNDWAQHNALRLDGEDPDTEQELLKKLAQDLTTQLAQSQTIASDVEIVLLQTDALRVATDALSGQSDKQARLLQHLLEDLQGARVENSRLHGATLSAVKQQAQAILAAQAQGSAAVGAHLRELIAAVQRLEAAASKPSPAPGGISIGGSVGTYQSLNISGGTVTGPIIGKQVNYGAPPAAGAPARHDIEEARELLDLQRKTLALHLRRASRGDTAAAQQVAQAREEIARLKAQLRAWGQAVADEPGDEG